jgi:thiol-disulfide isomerase/thioredoxin
VRSDTNLNKRFAEEGVDTRQYGSMPGVLDTNIEVDGKRVLRSHSFSGSESNSVFYNRNGKAFDDISGISGLDSIADGRAFAYFDYDHDGKTDVVLTNSNNPQLQLFHNEVPTSGNSVSVQLVGGNTSSEQSEEWSPRDGYGAHVLVDIGAGQLRRELRCGDGFAAQNSRTLTIGIGHSKGVDKLTVEWPSGKRSEFGTLAAGHLAIVHENAAEAELGEGGVRVEATEVPQTTGLAPTMANLKLPIEADLAVVVTMATWCPICRGEIPNLTRLAEATAGKIAFYGLPIDPDDTDKKLSKYRIDASPPYEILRNLTAAQREEIDQLMEKHFGDHPLPTTFIVDSTGRVLLMQKGIPTVSQLRNLVRK